MSLGQEPRNGDFVAFLDELQRESAARLAAGHVVLPPSFDSAHEKAATVPVLTRAQAEALRARLAAGGNREILPALLLAVGLIVFFGGFIAHGGFASLVIGVALIAWSLNRLARLRAQRGSAPGSTDRTT
jgi:hypothetical protein